MFDVLALDNWDDDSTYYDGYGTERPLGEAWNGTEYVSDGGEGRFSFRRAQETQQVKIILEIYTRPWQYPGIYVNWTYGFDLILFGGDYDSGLGQPVDTIENLGEPREFLDKFWQPVTLNKTRYTWTFPAPLMIHQLNIEGAGGYSQGRPWAITGLYLSTPLIPSSSDFWTNFNGQSERQL